MATLKRFYIHEGLTEQRPLRAGSWQPPILPQREEPSEAHVHDNLEIFWNDAPLLVHVGGETLELKQPQVALAPPLTPHLAWQRERVHRVRGQGHHLSILERALFGESHGPAFQSGLVRAEHTALVLPTLRYLHDRLNETGGEAPAELRGVVGGLVALLTDLGYRGSQHSDRNLGPIQRALEVLYARYADSDLMMDHLADAAGFSIAQFRRVFRQVTGEAPLSYLTRHRLEQARLLLAKGEITVEAVANRVGFDSPGSFYRRYRQYFGQSPRADQRPVVVDEVARTWAPPNTYAPSRT